MNKMYNLLFYTILRIFTGRLRPVSPVFPVSPGLLNTIYIQAKFNDDSHAAILCLEHVHVRCAGHH